MRSGAKSYVLGGYFLAGVNTHINVVMRPANVEDIEGQEKNVSWL